MHNEGIIRITFDTTIYKKAGPLRRLLRIVEKQAGDRLPKGMWLGDPDFTEGRAVIGLHHPEDSAPRSTYLQLLSKQEGILEVK